MAGKLVTSFYDTTAPLQPDPGSHPGWWLPSQLLLPPELTTGSVSLRGFRSLGV